MQIVVKNLENKEVGKVDLNDQIFNAPSDRSDILHRVVQWQLSKARSGCHKVKGRSEVTGTTKKIYKQKGTGQARHGAATAPIFVGGGIVFGPVVRSHEYSLNKKVRKMGLKVALSLKHSQNSIIVLDSAEMKEVKASALREKLNGFGGQKFLIVDKVFNENTSKSASNLKHVNVLPSIGLNVVDILKHDRVLITKAALEDIEARLAC